MRVPALDPAGRHLLRRCALQPDVLHGSRLRIHAPAGPALWAIAHGRSETRAISPRAWSPRMRTSRACGFTRFETIAVRGIRNQPTPPSRSIWPVVQQRTVRGQGRSGVRSDARAM